MDHWWTGSWPTPSRVRRMLRAASIAAALSACPLAAPPASAAAKDQFTEWRLDLQFVNGSKKYSEAEIGKKITDWVAEAERFYRRRPALKISYTVIRMTHKGGQDLSQLQFESDAEYARFMDEHFDVVAASKTEGYLPVLLTDEICRGTDKKTGKPKCVGGIGFFPHLTQPLGRKRGITIAAYKDERTLAHELGHVFGLRHTFDEYVDLNAPCNKDYKPKGKPEGQCNSCASGKIVYDENNDPAKCDGPVNLMDYCTNTKTDYEFLNPCQEQRAANQRYRYMTDEGKTNYYRLKGLAGEAICDSDPECEDGQYCDKGVVAGVGRNQCKDVKPIGTACTRGGECLSGRCSLLNCAAANECMTDGDCGAGRYCNTGLAELGRNACETQLANGRACTGDHQCGSGHCSQWRPQDGQVSGICYVPGAKAAGDSCLIDLECKAGKCNSKKQCVCKNDADCGSGFWCDAGLDLKDNVCKRKLDKGESCGKAGSFGNDHKCKSGNCSGFPDYECK
jgi:hypothetical protein